MKYLFIKFIIKLKRKMITDSFKLDLNDYID